MQRSRNGRTNERRYTPAPTEGRAKQRAFIFGANEVSDDLSELKELLRTAGVATVGETVQPRDKPHPNVYIGPGKVTVTWKFVAGSGGSRLLVRRG